MTEPRRFPWDGYAPSPRAAAVVVMAMLGLGVLLGSATSQVAQSAGISTVVLEMPTPKPDEPEELATAAPESSPEAAPEEPVAVPSTAPVPEEAPLVEEEPAPEEPAPEVPEEPVLPPELEPEGLPEVKHVFLIVLGENGYEETFGDTSAAPPAPYLAKELPAQGELISNYYAVTYGDLANQIALLSGQGPTLETAAGCPVYTDIVPGTISPDGQVEGAGCIYPAKTPTLLGQLVDAKLKWRAYIEGVDGGVAAGLPATCRRPELGAADPSQMPLPGDPYLTRRNPFLYFHSLLDFGECDKEDVGLSRLATDLKSAKKTPALSYIVPDACHDGGEAPCEEGRPAGPAETEEFLREVVPQIIESPAYEDGGLIAITSSQAPQTGPNADPSACCVDPVYANLPPPAEAAPTTGAVKPSGGGGKVGLLLISPFVEAGTVNETAYFNHYSLLLTLEELFALEKTGYAAEPALVPFDETIFNAPVAEEELPLPESGGPQSSRISAAVSRPSASPIKVNPRSGQFERSE